MSNASPRLRIAIVGGGIGGLSLATFLSLKGADDLLVDIYETNSSLTELGAGLGVWPRTQHILASVGLGKDLERASAPGREISGKIRKSFGFRIADQGNERSQTIYDMEYGSSSALPVHRADFQRMLAKYAIPFATPHFCKKLVNYGYLNQNDKSSDIILRFTDGSTARTDVLIGADGIHSMIRGELFRRLGIPHRKLECPSAPQQDVCLSTNEREQLDAVSDLTEPVWCGQNAYRCLIPVSLLETRYPDHPSTKGPLIFLGRNKHIVSYPVALIVQGETRMAINVVATVSERSREGTRVAGAWVRPIPKEELLAAFKGWVNEVQVLIELADKPQLWAVHTIKDLPCFTDADGRVAILGDAAHAMQSHTGAGAGQALEDAFVLAELLAHPLTTRATIGTALTAYNFVRVPESQRVVEASRRSGLMYQLSEGWDHSTAPYGDSIAGEQSDSADKETRKLRQLASAIAALHKFQWASDAGQSQGARAVAYLEQELMKNSDSH